MKPPVYSLAAKGESCLSGSTTILNTVDCETACNGIVGIVGLFGKMKDGNPCYVAGNGKCRQDGNDGSGASLICECRLYNIILLYLSVLFVCMAKV